MKRPLAQVLVVDDDAIIALDLRRLLQEMVAKTTVASSGEEALKLCGQQPFDLVILNIHLPGISGLEVCRRMKQDPKLRSIPVIFLSGEPSLRSLGEVTRLGAAGYVTKPYEPAQLKARVLAALGHPPEPGEGTKHGSRGQQS